MSHRYTVFVCQNVRPPADREGCCAARGGRELLQAFHDAVEAAGLAADVRVRPSGCLDACPHGPVAVVYEGDMSRPPSKLARLWTRGTWYGGLVARDAAAIAASHLRDGEPLARCRF